MRRQEQGSILVIVVAVIAIMALMSAALLTVVSINRDASVNTRMGGLAETVVDAAKAHVIAMLDAEAVGDKITTLGGAWASTFEVVKPDATHVRFIEIIPPVGANSTSIPINNGYQTFLISDFSPSMGTSACTNLWEFTDCNDPYPDDDKHQGWGRWIYIPMNDLTLAKGDARYSYRYAVNIIDLSGRWLATPPPTMSTTERAKWAKRLSYQIFNQDADFNFFNATATARAALEKTYNPTTGGLANTLMYTWEGIRTEVETRNGGAVGSDATWLMMLTPFGMTGADLAADSGTTIGWSINAMTAPRIVAEGLVFGLSEETCGSGADPDVGAPGIDALQATDGTAIEPMGDADTTSIQISGSGQYSAFDGADYTYDIAYALLHTIRDMREGTFAASMDLFQKEFLTNLDPWSSLRLENSGWQCTGTASSTFTKNATYATIHQRAERIETALNDTLQSLFAGYTGRLDTGTGLYTYDWNGDKWQPAAANTIDSSNGATGTAAWNDATFFDLPDYGFSQNVTPPVSFKPPQLLYRDGFPGQFAQGYATANASIFETGSSTEGAEATPDPKRSWTGTFFVGRSHFFRVIIRAQVIDAKNGNSVESERNLEFVYCSDPNGDGNPADSHIIYQRWVIPPRE